MGRFGIGILAMGLLLAAASGLWWREPPAPREERPSLAQSLAGDAAAGFARAIAPRPFLFPRDHGPHPEFQTEWWYYTGNLQSAQGRAFGYQLTFFRLALSPAAPPRSSAWAANQIYMAHFALTDAAGGRFHHFERFSRGALGLAGAQAEPFRVWLEDWSAAGGGHPLPMGLHAAAGEVAIDLTLAEGKPVVLQGEQGLSRKSTQQGNASYYYSLTRMPTAGTIRIGAESFPVEGSSWLDREWSSSALGPDQVGWDWFSLQLDDGRELMYYRLRRRDGSADPLSGGTLVERDGRSRRLGPEEVGIEVLERWRSPHSGADYPARWRLRIPAEGLELELTPLLADQELQTRVRYWEGAVRAQGRAERTPVGGRGYVELTGYAD